MLCGFKQIEICFSFNFQVICVLQLNIVSSDYLHIRHHSRYCHWSLVCDFNHEILWYYIVTFYPFLFRMHEADMGFVLVVDRRNDKWSSVKSTLLKISVSLIKRTYFLIFNWLVIFIYIHWKWRLCNSFCSPTKRETTKVSTTAKIHINKIWY